MTRSSSPGARLAANVDLASALAASRRQGADPPTPRDALSARVPAINHPQPLSPRISEAQQADRTHRRQAIETLLHHYRDVLEGIPDKEHSRSDDLLALMCPAWNHRSYRQLEQRLAELKKARPKLHAKLETRFLRYTERRIAWCKKCGEHPASDVGAVHRHPPGRSVSLRPKMVRVLPRNDDPIGVALALDWLEARWLGRADLPKAVFEIEAERRLRAA